MDTVKAQYLTQIGLRDSVYSEILKESRQFFVQFPEGFDPQSDEQYPVAFILDGEILFPALAVTQRFYMATLVLPNVQMFANGKLCRMGFFSKAVFESFGF